MTHAGNDRPRALVLDLDGTLLDTVYFHVTAWWESFLAAGYEVSCVDIHQQIGRGGADLVRTLVGAEDGRVVTGHDERWAPLRERCRTFHEVPELVRTCAERGLSVVYCTSASDEDTADFRAKVGCDDVVAAVVSSGEVEQSKPAADIVRAALAAIGAQPDDAVMLGDTVYDVQAASAAGVTCVGVGTGGICADELSRAGAAACYANPSELLQGLDDSPLGRLLLR